MQNRGICADSNAPCRKNHQLISSSKTSGPSVDDLSTISDSHLPCPDLFLQDPGFMGLLLLQPGLVPHCPDPLALQPQLFTLGLLLSAFLSLLECFQSLGALGSTVANLLAVPASLALRARMPDALIS